MWEIIVAIILGFVEGMTEFAPVSSTGHLILVDDVWLKSSELFSVEVANTFKVVIQLGAILAVVVLFQERFRNLLGFGNKNSNGLQPQKRLSLVHVIVGLFPAGILGFLFVDYIDEHLFTMLTVLLALVVGAILMIAADIFRPRKPTIETVDQITILKAFLIGLIQCISLWPGFSRSGSTIAGGVLLGLSYRAASDFTFIMAVPIMLGASAVSLYKHWQFITPDTFVFFAVGFISAFIFSLIAIHFFLKMISQVKLLPFAIYRIILAGVLYFIFFM